jgi:membrane fusion protein, multidrug efflux system
VRVSLACIWVVAVAAAVGCQRKPTPEAKAKPIPAVEVESALIDDHPVPKTLVVTGTLEADQRTELAANASGRVLRTFVERGDHVKAGALLAQLDTRGAALSHAEAEANAKAITEQLESVRSECGRYAALRDKGAITQQEYDKQAVQCRTQASSEEAARARLADAARVIQDAAIRAPFAGVIGERFINVGDYLQPNSKVVTLLVDDPLRLRLSIPEPAIPYAKEGTEVRFKVLTLPDREFTARIKYVGREVRPTTRDLINEAVVDNRERLLLPGTFVTAELPTGKVSQALVPKNALIDSAGERTVFAIVDKRLEQRAIHTGMTIDDRVAVSEGLKKGDRVVINPKPDLKDGSPVVLR